MTKYDLAISNLKISNVLNTLKEQLYEENKRDIEVLEQGVKVLDIIKKHIVVDSVGNIRIRSITSKREQEVLKEFIK